MHKVKGNPDKQKWLEAGLDNLQAQIDQIKEALGKNIQRNTFIKWDDQIVNLTNAKGVKLVNTRVETSFGSNESMFIIDVSRNDHIKKLAAQVGEKAFKDAADVVFGWVQKSLIECGAGIVDIEANLNQLQLKGEKPIELTKEMEVVPGSIEDPKAWEKALYQETVEVIKEDEAAREAVAEDLGSESEEVIAP